MSLNSDFLETLRESFEKCLDTSPRSNEKLKILHSKIAKDLSSLLGKDYIVDALNFGSGREQTIKGRYLDKKVDICVSKKKKVVAGIAVKFVMSNYSQNSNNYFENMLGETANIRTADILYFQMFIIPRFLPYFDNSGVIQKIEELTKHNVDKYIKLSNDDTGMYFHAPNKTLFVLLDSDTLPKEGQDKKKYKEKCKKSKFSYSLVFKNSFKSQVVYNDYESFIKKVFHAISAV